MNRKIIIIAIGIVVVLGGGIAGATYWAASGKSISIDNAQLNAPLVTLAPTAPGILRALYVHEGDVIAPNAVVAQVGVELIKSSQGGLVLATHGDIGDQVAPGNAVVDMIDPSSLRVVGEIDENKGFNLIKVGEPVSFTVDAFGGKQFTGVVDEISPTSKQSGVVFNISSQREVQQFEIKARFDTAANPELKNGMSARMTVWTE